MKKQRVGLALVMIVLVVLVSYFVGVPAYEGITNSSHSNSETRGSIMVRMNKPFDQKISECLDRLNFHVGLNTVWEFKNRFTEKEKIYFRIYEYFYNTKGLKYIREHAKSGEPCAAEIVRHWNLNE